jgi:beta-glucosidase
LRKKKYFILWFTDKYKHHHHKMKHLIANKLLVLLMAVCLFSSLALVNHKHYQYNFQDTSLPIDKRVNDLVAHLTLEEKVAQMLNSAPAVERLGIPAYNWWNECLHGVARTPFKVTVYPQAIGMAATFDKNSLHQMADYTAEEGRAINNESIKNGNRSIYLGLTYWTPNINIFRDPRWGRGQETYGEDPYLTGALGKAFVTGLQGNDPKYLKAAACAKHYAIHSGPESSRHEFNADVSDYDLWDTYLPAFRQLVVNAKVAGVMCAYNAYKSQPCCGNDLLMNNILRNEWNFKGYVTSDCGAIDDFYLRHKTHTDAESAAADAVLHGTDVECGNVTYKSLISAVKDGKLTEQQLDVSVKRLFTIRFRLGMFDPPQMVKYAQIPISVLESPAHKAMALKMARQSVVLLKNQDHILPLSKHLKKIAIMGPNADNALSILGNYNGTPSKLVTALQGIETKLGPGTEVIYEKGTDFIDEPTVKPDYKAIAERVKDADVIIFVGGISPQLEGEEMQVNKAGFSGGDRTSIALPDDQTQLLKALKATGKPVVFVIMTGSAIAIPWEAEHIPAILNAWYGGQEAGTAIADVIFGDYNPAGRLPVTLYKSDSDLPAFTDYSMNNRTYRYFKGKPLYSFGYGLSYSSFRYDNMVAPVGISKGKNVSLSVRITNKGKMDGEEVAELYVSHLGLKVKTPIRALKGFERTFIKAGQSKIIRFELTPEDLSLIGTDGRTKEPGGKIMISVGGSQPDAQTQKDKKTVSKEVSIGGD